MAIRRSRRSPMSKRKNRRKLFSKEERNSQRNMQLERLEDRCLLAGPQLVGIQPNDGALLQDGDIRDIAPSDLMFRFDESQRIDVATLGDTSAPGGIQITRSNLDGSFDPATVVTDFNTPLSAVQVRFSAVRLGEEQNGIELVFSKRDQGRANLPTVGVVGRVINISLNTNDGNETTALDLKNAIELDADASSLIRVEIEAGNVNTDIATPSISYSPLVLSGATDIVIKPGFIGLGDSPNEVVIRFGETLPDDTYRIDVFGTFANALRNENDEAFNDTTDDGEDNGASESLEFELDLGAQITSVIPQPMQRKADGSIDQARNMILVYFSDDDLTPAAAQNPAFYQLIRTNETVQNTDDEKFNPTTVTYNSDTDSVLLEFDKPLDELSTKGPGSFRLRIGTDEAIPVAPTVTALPADPGSSFDRAEVVDGGMGWVTGAGGMADGITQSIIISQEIVPTDVLDDMYDLDLPGSNDEPGHRDFNITSQRHVLEDAADSVAGIQTFYYNFRGDIGSIVAEAGDPPQPAFNTITDTQKLRSREILEIISSYTGVQFVETDDQGFTLAVGDTDAINTSIIFDDYQTAVSPEPNARTGNTDVGLTAILNDGLSWTDEFGGTFFQEMFEQVGHILNLQHTFDLPPLTIMGHDLDLQFDNDLEPDFPGDADLVHLNHLYRPESKDIDLYKFELTQPGLLTAETIAERQRDFRNQDDLLDSVLTLYQVRVELDPTTGEPLEDVGNNLIPVLDANGNEIRDLIARNDDYFSEDSFLELSLRRGMYYVAVTASGNDNFDPTIHDSGFGGVSEGEYDVRLTFRPNADAAITDIDNPPDPTVPGSKVTPIDGDSDGVPGGVYNFWFRAAAPSGLEGVDEPRVVYVDASLRETLNYVGDGTLGTPFGNMLDALNVNGAGVPRQASDPASTAPNAARPGDIVRIVANPGALNDIRTEADNWAYEVGFNELGISLADGSTLEVPKGVTMMVDAGTIFKLRRARIGAGSSSPGPQKDRSAGAFQVLGAPVFVDQLGNTLPLDIGAPAGVTDEFDAATPLMDLDGKLPEPAVVHFTSYNNEGMGLDTFGEPTTPDKGDWGGIVFRADIDNADQTRFSYEEQGIFLNYVNHADMEHGGGSVVVESVPQIVTPIQILESRPTVSFNHITLSRDAAMSASPNSFEETNFHAPRHQENAFTSDYTRIGPEIHGNRLMDNSENALFVRVETPAGDRLQELTVPGRWDDTDIVHLLKENLVIEGTPGGPFLELIEPSLERVVVTPLWVDGGTLGDAPIGKPVTYNYRLVFVDGNGNESRPSNASRNVVVDGTDNAVQLTQLLTADGDFVARRLYRSQPGGGAPYDLIAQINQSDKEYIDDGTTKGGTLDEAAFRLRPRFDARLAIDPAVVVKMDGARIQTEIGAQFIAEGRDGNEIIFTSVLDDRYGAGATFDTSNDGPIVDGGPNDPQPGSWGGIYAGRMSGLSIDHAVIAYGGGITRIEGTFAGFNVVEIHQAEARVAHSLFEFNASGFGGQAPRDRFGRGFNEAGVIFVRGAQPVIFGNTIRNNADTIPNTYLAAININTNALNHKLKVDPGRSTGFIERLGGFRDNQGPLIVDNRLSNNDINGMVVRGETVTTQNVWDDTDIAHVLFDTIYIPDFHTFGGLRLESSSTQSLVVKLLSLDPQGLDSTIPDTAGFWANGRPLEIDDRIGGALQIIGQPKSPVVLTSLYDDTEGAGLKPNGDPQTDTNNDGDYRFVQGAQAPAPGDWNSVILDRYAHDRNVKVVIESEARDENPPGSNATALNAEFLGTLAPHEKSGDDNLRLGFEVLGFLTNPLDRDVYSFEAEAGTEVWIDLDRTRHAFDPILELIDGNDTVLARSMDSGDESKSPTGFGFTFQLDATGAGALTNGDTFTLTNETPSGGVKLVFEFRLGGGGLAATSDVEVPYTAGDTWDDLADAIADAINNISVNYPADTDPKAIPPVLPRADRADLMGLRARAMAEGRVRIFSERDVQYDPLTPPLPVIPVVDTLLYEDASVAGTVHKFQKTPPFDGVDLYTTNPRDPGFRLILPGPDGTRNTYHLRVRSNTEPGDLDNVNGGLTSGAYQMQIRLHEMDELPGSTVAYTNISYADIGVTVLGQPIHSPLLGEQDEIEIIDPDLHVIISDKNDRYQDAQDIGNLLTADRATLSVAGDLIWHQNPDFVPTGPNVPNGMVPPNWIYDIDWYSFEINSDELSPQLGDPYWPVTFDIDYADGLARPNTELFVFDSGGNFIFTSRDANVAEDRPGPLQSGDVDDLTRGSVGAKDAFIGTQELPPGRYYVAVSTDGRIPAEMAQFTSGSPANPLLRLEPLDSTIRIAEEHIDFDGTAFAPATPGNVWSTTVPPVVLDLVDDTSAIPWHLGDTTMFFIVDEGRERARIGTVDPFTGQVELSTSRFNIIGDDVHDIAIRDDGYMYGFSHGLDANLPPGFGAPADVLDGDTGQYLRIDQVTGNASSMGSSGIFTYEMDPATGNNKRAHRSNNTDIGYGVHMNAIAFGPVARNGPSERLLGVGNRGELTARPGLQNGVDIKQNILYQFNTETGAAFDDPGGTRTVGAWTDAIEIGEVLTSPQLTAPDATTSHPINTTVVYNISDGETFEIDDGIGVTTFEFDFGPQVQQNIDLANRQTLHDGEFFVLDPDADPLVTGDEVVYQFNTGPVIEITAPGPPGGGFLDANIVTITDNTAPAPVTRSFEFDSDPTDTRTDPTAVRVIFGSTNVVGLAGQLANAINAQANYNVAATVVGNRVSLAGDTTVFISNGTGVSPTGLNLVGHNGEAPIVQVLPDPADPTKTLLTDNDKFEVTTDFGTTSHTFVFDDTSAAGALDPGYVVTFDSTTDSPEDVGTRILATILGIAGRPLEGIQAGSRVAINALGVASVALTNPGPAPLSWAIANQIGIEESFTADQIGQQVQGSVAGAITASSFATGPATGTQLYTGRISFQGAEVGDFRGVSSPAWTDLTTAGGVVPGNNPIQLLAGDTAVSTILPGPPIVNVPGVAEKIADAINDVLDPVVTAGATGTRITITGGRPDVSGTPGLTAAGAGPGGWVTGITMVGNDVYAVSDKGGLYHLSMSLIPSNAPTLTTTYITTSAADLEGINFQGLTAGPPNVENGRYANMLFAVEGVDTDGNSTATNVDFEEANLYAFDLNGVLQPVFIDGQTSVQIVEEFAGLNFDVQDILGIEFSTLDHNLFHATPNTRYQAAATAKDVRMGVPRLNDGLPATLGDPIWVEERQGSAGHGVNRAPDGTRLGNTGGAASIHFGDGTAIVYDGFDGGGQIIDRGIRTYEYPGGAHGSFITNEFSLQGYSAQDRPVLYFNYWSAAQSQANGTDAFDVYIADNDGDWDTLRPNPGAIHNDTTLYQTVNGGTWRQVRIPLDDYAGSEHLRIRFDFSTAGDFNIGQDDLHEIFTGGTELRAIDGRYLRDGDTFELGRDHILNNGDEEVFEFESGFTLIPPSGGALAAADAGAGGLTFDIELDDDADPLTPQVAFTFEFDAEVPSVAGVTYAAGNVPIAIEPFNTAADVARFIQTAMSTAFPFAFRTYTHLNEERLNLQIDWDGTGFTDVTNNLPSPQFDTFVEGTLGRNHVAIPDSTLVYVHEGMPRWDAAVNDVAEELNRVIEPTFYDPTLVVDHGSNFRDGDRFDLDDSDSATPPAVFEFDAGWLMQVDANGGSAFTDGQTFQLSDVPTGTSTLIFEFNDGPLGDIAGTSDVEIPFNGAESQVLMATAIRDAIRNAPNPERTAMQLDAFVLSGGRVQIRSTDATVLTEAITPLGVDVNDPNSRPGVGRAFLLQVDPTGAAALGDTETFTLSDIPNGGANDLVFEFNSVGGLTGDEEIWFTGTESQAAIAQRIADEINTATPLADRTALGLSASARSDGRVLIYATRATTLVEASGGLTIPAPQPVVTPLLYRPSSEYKPSNVAALIETEIDGVAGFPTDPLTIDATVDARATRRVHLNNTGGFNTDIVFSYTAKPASPGTIELELDFGTDVVANDIVKQYEDLIRVIGHTVEDPGPLGFDDALPGDAAGRTSGVHHPRSNQNNMGEGIYFDDIIIGFAERGEMVTGASGNTATVPTGVTGRTEGEYQLEIRRSEPYRFVDTYDTNDRQSQGYTIVAQDGSLLTDGETFTLTDGVNSVVFEYEDTIRGDGVAAGHIEVQFDSQMTNWNVARNIRDAINRSQVRAEIDVLAALADGREDVLLPDLDNPDTRNLDLRDDLRANKFGAGPITTDNRVNLFGSVWVMRDSNRARLPVEDLGDTTANNDVIAGAVDTGITSVNSPSFLASGVIGDKPIYPLQPGKDVDIYEVTFSGTIRIDVDADEIGSTLDPVLQVFTAAGNLFRFSDDDPAPGEIDSFDPYIEFTAGGTYYVAVSGFGNTGYDPTVAPTSEDNTTASEGSTGFYHLDMTFGISTETDLLLFDEVGDQNLFRDQGQILIHSNRIRESRDTGILVDAGARRASEGNAPHLGTPRQLDEINRDLLAPGVVVENNVVSNSGLVGIHIKGLDQTAGSPVGAVPFGRVVNNTVFGIGGDLLNDPTGDQDIGILVEQYAGPTLLNNIVANFWQGVSVDATSATANSGERLTVVGGMLYQGNLTHTDVAVEDFDIILDNTDPLFMAPRSGNFYLAPGSQDAPNRAIDSSVGSLEERFRYQLIKDPLGIARSPIIAPDLDVTGQLRVDDPLSEPPAGLGGNVFIDRGGFDRSDFAGPTTLSVTPRDNDADGVDSNSAERIIEIAGTNVLPRFDIRLVDGVLPADPNEGIGIDDSTVVTEAVIVKQDGVVLEDGLDYRFSYNTTNDTVTITPLSGIWESDRIYTVLLNNIDHHRVSFPDGNQLPDGTQFAIVDGQGDRATFEFESGYRLQVPQTLALQVPAAGGALGGVEDRQIFLLSNGTNPPRRFEFDRTSLNNGVDANAIAIPFDVNDTADEIAQTIADKIRAEAPELGLSPRGPNDAPYHDLGLGVVHLGALNNHTVDITLATLTPMGTEAVAIEDGDLFTIDDGSKFVTFEFENTVIGDDVAAGNVAVNFRPFDTHEGIAQAIIDAIIAQKLGLAPEDLGDGHIFVDGQQRHILDTVVSPTNNTSLSQSGAPGVYPAFGLQLPIRAGALFGLQDAETITIQDGLNAPVTFEFDNIDVDPGLVNVANVRVAFDNSSSVEDVANAIRNAILGAGVGLNPIYRGDGILDLQGSTTNHSISLLDTTVTQRGAPGVDGAIPIVITPVAAFDDTQVAVAAIEAINGGPLDVQASAGGGPVVVIEGATAVNEQLAPSDPDYVPVFATNDFFGAIKDLAGNNLKPNLLSGETQTTIELGKANMDFGDAPQTAVDYPTDLGHNGPVHVITGNGWFLGGRIDAEPDGQVSADATGDDDDSNGFAIDVDVAKTDGNVTTTSPITPATITVGSVDDGNYFSITTPVDTYDFEFENTALDDGAAAGHIPVRFNVAMNADQLAAVVIDAILDARLGIAATDLGGGQVELNGDDEDGVEVKGDFRPDPLTPTQITVTASADGLLDAWIDFNIDGDFDDAGEQIFASQQLSAGDNTFLVETPTSAVAGDTVARFRFSSTGGLRPTGLAADGEIEDYWVTIDNGNAPTATDDSYTTDEDTPNKILDVVTNVIPNGADTRGDGLPGPLEILTFQAISDQGAIVSLVNPLDPKELFYNPTSVAAIAKLGTGDALIDTFTYRVFDGKFTSPEATVTVTVTGINDDPIAIDDTSIFTTQDAPIDINVLANDSDPEDGTVGLVINSVTANVDLADPAHAGGVFIHNTRQSIALGAAAGTVTLAYDGTSGSPATSLTYDPGISPTAGQVQAHLESIPKLAGNVTVTGSAGGLFDVRLQGGAENVPMLVQAGGTATATITQVSMRVHFDPLNGLAADFRDLDAGETRNDEFTYTIRDADGGVSNSATVTVTVSGIDDRPDANDDIGANFTTDEDNSTTVLIRDANGIFGNDEDPENPGDVNALTLVSVDSSFTRGRITLNGSPPTTITYDPDDKFEHLLPGWLMQVDSRGGTAFTDGDTFTLADGTNSQAFKFDSTVTSDNPLTTEVEVPYLSGHSQTVIAQATVDAINNVTPPNPMELQAVVTNGGGVLIRSTNGSPITLTESAGGAGGLAIANYDRFAYVVRDASGNVARATVTMTVNGVNDKPEAYDFIGPRVAENATVTFDVLAHAFDIDQGDTLTVVDTKDTASTISKEGDPGTDFYVVAEDDGHGVTIGSDNEVTYDPNGWFDILQPGQELTDKFVFVVEDAQGQQAEATVTVTVFGANDPPVAEDDDATTTEDASVTIFVLGNDENNNLPNPLTVVAIGNDPNKGGPPTGRVTIDPTAGSLNNAVIYSPDGQFDHLKSVNDTATDSFTYQVSDGVSTAWGTVTVTITGVNDAPIANLDPNGYTVQRGGTLNVNAFADGVLFNDTDADDLQTDLDAVLKQGPQHAATNGFTLSDNGTFTYTHNGNSATTDIFQYAAIDPQGAESQQIVTVVITITEPPPAEWQNPINRFDVNNDGSVSPIDVLLVINHINNVGSSVPAPPETPPPYVNVDGSVTVTGEENVTPLDVLLVITEINRLNASQGEGERVATAEGESAPVPAVIDVPVMDIGSSSTSQSVQLVSAEPLSASSNHVDEPVRDERSTLASRLDRSEKTRDRAEETVHVDPFGVEDALSAIAAEVSGSQAGRTALDDVLEELLG